MRALLEARQREVLQADEKRQVLLAFAEQVGLPASAEQRMEAEHVAALASARTSGFADALHEAARLTRGEALAFRASKQDIDAIEAIADSAVADLRVVRDTFAPSISDRGVDIAHHEIGIPQRDNRTNSFSPAATQEVLDTLMGFVPSADRPAGRTVVSVALPNLSLVFVNQSAESVNRAAELASQTSDDVDTPCIEIDVGELTMAVTADGDKLDLCIRAEHVDMDDRGVAIAMKPCRLLRTTGFECKVVSPDGLPPRLTLGFDTVEVAWMRASMAAFLRWRLPKFFVDVLVSPARLRGISVHVDMLRATLYEPTGTPVLGLRLQEAKADYTNPRGAAFDGTLVQLQLGSLFLHELGQDHRGTSTELFASRSEDGSMPWVELTLGQTVEGLITRRRLQLHAQPFAVVGRLRTVHRLAAAGVGEATFVAGEVARAAAEAAALGELDGQVEEVEAEGARTALSCEVDVRDVGASFLFDESDDGWQLSIERVVVTEAAAEEGGAPRSEDGPVQPGGACNGRGGTSQDQPSQVQPSQVQPSPAQPSPAQPSLKQPTRSVGSAVVPAEQGTGYGEPPPADRLTVRVEGIELAAIGEEMVSRSVGGGAAAANGRAPSATVAQGSQGAVSGTSGTPMLYESVLTLQVEAREGRPLQLGVRGTRLTCECSEAQARMIAMLIQQPHDWAGLAEKLQVELSPAESGSAPPSPAKSSPTMSSPVHLSAEMRPSTPPSTGASTKPASAGVDVHVAHPHVTLSARSAHGTALTYELREVHVDVHQEPGPVGPGPHDSGRLRVRTAVGTWAVRKARQRLEVLRAASKPGARPGARLSGRSTVRPGGRARGRSQDGDQKALLDSTSVRSSPPPSPRDRRSISARRPQLMITHDTGRRGTPLVLRLRPCRACPSCPGVSLRLSHYWCGACSRLCTLWLPLVRLVTMLLCCLPAVRALVPLGCREMCVRLCACFTALCAGCFPRPRKARHAKIGNSSALPYPPGAAPRHRPKVPPPKTPVHTSKEAIHTASYKAPKLASLQASRADREIEMVTGTLDGHLGAV